MKNILIYVGIVIFVILIRAYIMVPIRVDGPSMEPTLKDGNIMLLNKTAYWAKEPKRFDMVVIDEKGTAIIKRIIGLPGEYVKIKENKLYINNNYTKEVYKHYLTKDYQLNKKIPNNYYFVMGDNRPVSNDSRYFGLVSKKDILGSTNLSFFPPKIYK